MENGKMVSIKKSLVSNFIILGICYPWFAFITIKSAVSNLPEPGASPLKYVLPAVSLIFLLLYTVFVVIIIRNLILSKKELLVIDGNKVTLTTKKGVTTTYDITDIYTVTAAGVALTLTGKGLKYTVVNLKNAKELHSALMAKILASRPAPVGNPYMQGYPAPGAAPYGQGYAPVAPVPTAPPAAPVAPTSVSAAASNEAEAIRKYKDLLDQGLITQEEYDAKKRQILGL